jgi:hypothetical protein
MVFGGRVMFVTIAAGYCLHDKVNKLRPAGFKRSRALRRVYF